MLGYFNPINVLLQKSWNVFIKNLNFFSTEERKILDVMGFE